MFFDDILIYNKIWVGTYRAFANCILNIGNPSVLCDEKNAVLGLQEYNTWATLLTTKVWRWTLVKFQQWLTSQNQQMLQVYKDSWD